VGDLLVHSIPDRYRVNYREPEMLQVLTPEGKLIEDIYEIGPKLSDKEILMLLNYMVLGRTIDRWAWILHRQGRIRSTYGSYEGHEAVDIGSAYALGSEDWISPSYRILGALLVRGMSPVEIFARFFGNSGDPQKGRNLTVEWGSRKHKVLSIGASIGPHIIFAVGFAYALRYMHREGIVMVYTGDGGTSSNGFHAGLNFAGVFRTPNVFVVINNQYAISVPVIKQTAVKRLSTKAAAYGLEGISVDGNDLLAVYKASKYAVDSVRNGGTPVLIEAVTYRLGPHTTADDPQTRYRPKEEVEEWRRKDPVDRVRRYLVDRGIITENDFKSILEDAELKVKEAVKIAESYPPIPPEELVKDVYSYIPWHLKEELEEILGDE